MRRTAYAAVALGAAPVASARIVAIKGFGPGDGRVVIARSDGSHVHRLAQGDDAQIAPNGKLVQVSNRDPGQQGTHPRVMVYRASGGKPLFVIRKSIFPIAWSPDSTMLVGTEGVTNDRLVVIDAASGARTTLLAGDFDAPTFSPDSTQIAFIRYGPGINYGGTLQIIDLATRTVRTLAEHASRPVWGPRAIAFETVFHNACHFSNLATIQPDGTGFRKLTIVPPRKTSGFYPVDWSDDRTRLLAGYHDQVTPITYAIDPIHGGARKIARGVYPQALSRDGRRVVGGTGNPYCCTADPINVVGVPWKGGKPHILIRKAFRASSND